MTRELTQRVGDHRAPVSVGSGILSSTATRVRSACGGSDPTHVLVVSDAAIEATHAEVVASSWKESGVPVSRMAIHASEANKSIASWQEIMTRAAELHLDRKSCIVAVGGGIVTDLAGFAAASFLRGISWVAVPTTVLGMVDAALGGKTGVNLSLAGGTLGKNLAGAFWPPSAVICDVASLASLPVRQVRAGLAECLKHALIADPSIEPLLSGVVESYASAEAVDQWRLIDLVARSAAVKLEIVARDSREAGDRMLLNLGHTFGHAIEAHLAAKVLHGEAVALGLVAAAFASAASGGLDLAEARSVRDRVAALGFEVRLPKAISAETLENAAGFDKKRIGGELTLILPVRGGGAQIARPANPQWLRAGFMAIGAS